MTRWFRPLLRGAVLIGLCQPLGPLRAQSIQGDVTDSTTGRLVTGGIVILVGNHDSVFASATTTERGTFAIAALAPGSYRLRVLRIGARPWTSPPLTLAGGAPVTRHLLVASEPVLLAEIVVTARTGCRNELSADVDVASLWEEARKALQLTDGAVAARLFNYRMTVTTRHSDPSGQMSTEEQLGRVGAGSWPIRSAPAANLLDHGYVQPADTIRGPRYFGPDANVFFSEGFLRSHCFRAVAAPKERSSLIGVGFEPQKSRQLPDIKGVMWLDRQTDELTEIEFEYTGLWRWVPPQSTGGRLDFVRLASGSWIISGWRMTAPVALSEPLRLDARVDPAVIPYFGNTRVKLAGFLEEDGLVEEVRGQDSAVVWLAPQRTGRR